MKYSKTLKPLAQSSLTINNAETRIRQLEFQIRRGNLETELMLKPFLERLQSQTQEEPQTADFFSEIETFERLVTLDDQSLFELLILRKPQNEHLEDEQLLSLVAKIRLCYLTPIKIDCH